ncbi:MAG: deoxyribodipyrimidine photolyase, partial [Comamonadaceae bacterium]|nr:deoxyribodipyrimidine photolyase [Comamonadaceae bacterium]
MNTYDKGLMWFRRDLRVEDNAALHHALKACKQVWCVFVFDSDILNPLARVDRRVDFIRESLVELDERLRGLAQEHGISGGGLIVRHARARIEVPALAQVLQVQAVFANHDDEPAALARDAQVFGDLAHAGILMHSHKDHVIFERREVLTQAGHAFGVFTPYKNAWLKQLTPYHLKSYPLDKYAASLAPVPPALASTVPQLPAIGFERSNLSQLPVPTGSSGAHQLFDDFVQRIERYEETRNFPAVKGPSYLSVHL